MPNRIHIGARLVAAIPALMVTCSAMLVAPTANAQLVPDRLYFGIERTAPMTVARPEGAEGELSLRVYSSVDAEPANSASVSEGKVDLAALFPELWRGSGTFAYVQLFTGQEAVGAPVVIQPMITPASATAAGRGQPPLFRRQQQVFSGVRAFVDKQVVLETTEGTIVIRLRPDVAPNHAWNFRHLADGGYYTDVIFHRVIDAKDGRPPFVIQVGDPTGTGSGGPGFQIDLEDSRALPHNFGVLSMARTNDPNTGGSQVFIALSRDGTSFLDGAYTTFGQVVEGAEPILAIAATQTNPQNDRPLEPPAIERAYLRDAPPIGSKPAPVQRPEESGER